MTRLAAAAPGPSAYWYATRGLGVVCLVVLTVTAVLGIGVVRKWGAGEGHGFVVAVLHRNASLLAVLLVAAHVATTLLDPFAHITVRDAIVPFGAAYRPVWLGLGVISDELLAAVVLTSLLRDRIGPGLWRLIHWAAYASWPLAVFHSLGTGSDARSPWLIGIATSCTTAVLLAVGARLWTGHLASVPLRLSAAAAAVGTVYVVAAWAVAGPFQPDWTLRSGTPAALLQATPSPRGPGGFSDALVGVLARTAGGYTQIALRDTVDTGLTLAIRSPSSTESLPVLTVARGRRTLCSVPASVTATLYAVCGRTRLTVRLYGLTPAAGNTPITGRLDTSGPLR